MIIDRTYPSHHSGLRLILSEDEKPHHYSRYAAQRADLIFESGAIDDPMAIEPPPNVASSTARVSQTSYLSNRHFKGVPKAPPFRIVPSEFLARARTQRPEFPDATASAFANWVYSLYGHAGTDTEALERGLAAEPVIFGERKSHPGAKSILASCDNALLAQQKSDWKLVHCGLHFDSEKDVIPFFEIATLAVGGRSLGASPDLVYHNTRTNEVVIVEVKLTRQSLPANLWPNVWAQLWCYANIPLARQATRVTVVGEVWGELHSWSRFHKASRQWVCLRASVRRDPRTPAYDDFFRSLFDIYRNADG